MVFERTVQLYHFCMHWQSRPSSSACIICRFMRVPQHLQGTPLRRFCFFLLLPVSSHASARVADKAALISLFRVLGGDKWKDAAWWDSDFHNANGTRVKFKPSLESDPCDTRWQGVGCVDPCEVNMLDRTISYSVAKATGQMQRLRCRKGRITSIVLPRNNLRGAITNWTAVGDLHNLTYLDLAFNNISGSLPTQLGKVRVLEHLDLSWNQLEGILPDSAFGALNDGAVAMTAPHAILMTLR